ncbi:MAG: hypothetical protein AABZ47_14780 [Planctomycetota bacterium]
MHQPTLSTAILTMLATITTSKAQVVTYEGTVFPEARGWQRLSAAAPKRQLEDGWLIQSLPNPARDSYRYNIGGMTSLVGRFFVEWRVVTDNPEWLIDEWQVPAVVSAGGRAGVLHHTVMTESAAVLLRDISIPRVIAPISVSEPHTYRIELFADKYIWYIDGVVTDSGIPEGVYPDPDAFLIWGAEVSHNDAPPATTAWDFVRAGRIPDDASGDFDSNEAIELFDYYYFHECLTNDRIGIHGGPDNDSGPGCRFTDFDGDSDVDLCDFAEFQNRFGDLN